MEVMIDSSNDDTNKSNYAIIVVIIIINIDNRVNKHVVP